MISLGLLLIPTIRKISKPDVQFCTSGGTLNWDDLRVFLAVARAGSISAGAKQLGVQHSTVSRRIRKLEHDLGVRLLERKNSGYELTTAGNNLKTSASHIEAEILGVDDTVLGQDKQLKGPLRISAINNMASSVPLA